MKVVKCSSCNAKIRENMSEKMGKKIYCSNCFEKAQAEEAERKKLIVVICEVFNINQPNGMMFSQIKQFKKEGITYQIARMTLQFLDKVENFQFEEKYGIGIVRYRYKDMINYYNKMQKKRQEVEAIDYKVSQFEVGFKNRENKIINNKLINLDDIIGGGEIE